MPGNTAYCLSKGGMRMLTRTAGVELAPHNILVVGGGTRCGRTPINKTTVADPKALAILAGDGASYITATTIFTDGGIMQSSPGL
jgi:glucose 1-dehydrogenase